MPDAKKQAEWLVMLYMNADSDNLEQPLQRDLRELCSPLCGADRDDEIVVVALIESGTGLVRRERLGSNGREPLEAHHAAGDFPLYDFVTRTAAEFPASRRMLVLWGHSAGIGDAIEAAPRGSVAVRAGEGLPAGLAVRAPVYPVARAPRRLGVAPVGAAPPGWPQIDIVGFDACYISSVELAVHVRAQLGERCRYLVSPESSISLNGWRYDWLAQRLVAEPTLEPEALARDIVAQVGRSPSAPRMLTLLDLTLLHTVTMNGGTDGLLVRMKPWVDELRAALGHRRRRRAVLDAFFATHWAGVRQYLDLSDLCRRLAQLPEGTVPGAVLRQHSRCLLDYLSREQSALVLDHAVSSKRVLGGLSIYCPWVRTSAADRRRGARDVEMSEAIYRELTFSKETGWWEVMTLPHIQDLVQRRLLEQALDDVQVAQPTRSAQIGRPWRRRETKPSDRETKPADRARRDDAA